MRFSRLVSVFFCLALFVDGNVVAQNFVEYPAHNATYGTHSVPATWPGGPTGLSVNLISDGTMHEDGNGFSQRTARNTLNYTPPSSSTNPQNYDNLDMIGVYGSRFPQLQQISASGTSTLVYDFETPVDESLDLFITDVDQSDAAIVRAYDAQGNAAIMSDWTVVGQGDLSVFKDTGTDASDIVAPNALVKFSATEISLSTIDPTNYNRAYTILRMPSGRAIDRIEITFTGTNNSPNRESGGNASHVYVALTTARIVFELEPLGFTISQGDQAAGSTTNLVSSDDSDLAVRRSNTSVQSIVTIDLETAGRATSYDSLRFVFEASVFARNNVTQTISLFDFNAGTYEVVDNRLATRFVDSSVSVVPTGDVSRFVDSSSGQMIARVSFIGSVPRLRFTANMDYASWKVIE